MRTALTSALLLGLLLPAISSAQDTPPAEPAAEAAPAEEPEASGESGLKLLGVVRGGTPSALIEYGGQQEIFRRGDPVFDQGTLREVGANSVVIEHDGKKIRLQIAAAPTPEPEPTPEAQVVEVAPPKAEPPPPPVAKAISRAEARAALQDLGKLLGDAEAERVQISGGAGVQLKKVATDSFFARLGLKSGDILQKLNGVAVNDPKNLPDLSAAAAGKELTVSFVRDEIGLSFARPLQ